ncbi:endonuclease/exonuclease/phosphatase family protein [Streptomyces sp. BBFR51]|uniref:endonuclease/exonuclease/phosphatase family protein n=1 Tax=Streptomyces sp. BBFR51 TaxID=3372856 RepID=UPI0037DC5C0E
MAELLGYHVVFGANIDNSPPAPGGHRVQYGTAILSRYPITASDNTWLYKSPGQAQRGLLHATLDVHGKKVEFYNTHLAASSQADRMQQTAQVVDLMGTTKPGILAGDFNALPAAPESQPLQKAYTDTWAKSRHARGDGTTYPAQSPTERIDLTYAIRKVTPLLTQVLKDDPTASDHRPLLSKVLVTPSGPLAEEPSGARRDHRAPDDGGVGHPTGLGDRGTVRAARAGCGVRAACPPSAPPRPSG